MKIAESSDPLDNTWVHPENYELARELLPLVQNKEKISADLKKKLAEKYSVGETTLNDIVDELQKPNRDPRADYPAPIMQKGVVAFEDLKPGMKVTGKIRNVVDFGAFVDIGLHETGLIHVSELSDNFVKDPMEVVKVGDVHEFTILNLDMDRRRISLSLKSDAASRAGTDEKSKVRGTAAASGGTGTGGKRVVVVKKGGASAGGQAGGFKRDQNGPRREKREFQGSDDGMMYNPFAALLKK